MNSIRKKCMSDNVCASYAARNERGGIISLPPKQEKDGVYALLSDRAFFLS